MSGSNTTQNDKPKQGALKAVPEAKIETPQEPQSEPTQPEVKPLESGNAALAEQWRNRRVDLSKEDALVMRPLIDHVNNLYEALGQSRHEHLKSIEEFTRKAQAQYLALEAKIRATLVGVDAEQLAKASALFKKYDIKNEGDDEWGMKFDTCVEDLMWFERKTR